MSDDKTVVGRTIAILDAVSDAVAPLTLAMLTSRTGIPKPTVRRIANDLVERGMLQHQPEGYWSGQRLMNQGLRSAQQHGLVTAAQPFVQDLYLRSRGGIAWFANFAGGQITLISSAFGRSDSQELTSRAWPTAGTIGRQLVLTMPGRLHISARPELVDPMLRPGPQPLTRYSITGPRGLTRLLTEARDSGLVLRTSRSSSAGPAPLLRCGTGPTTSSAH
ncbi:helix-turn-helix domain-containing protein [Gordonia jinhuaensis]|uniref:helix-turn-helix domain-containing protein n=1 Tax=Gordonia jinhuaensis TaxID=1517702 RepID=UPI00166A801F|nr:helix-turn-helix domain-containing protein [Gordonia jinhuaensis]